MIPKILFSPTQIHIERLKQWNWLNNAEVKQKEFVKLETKRCEILGNTTYSCMGTTFKLPEKFQMKFHLTNDHIERGGEKIDRPYQVNLNFNLN
jgi:hypothetical protein